MWVAGADPLLLGADQRGGTATGWRQAQALLDSEHARRAIGEVAVPFGVCAEPCAGCDHFRTDVSYLPDLQAYLDDLLRNRERLLATSGLDDWARAEATRRRRRSAGSGGSSRGLAPGSTSSPPTTASRSPTLSPSSAATAP